MPYWISKVKPSFGIGCLHVPCINITIGILRAVSARRWVKHFRARDRKKKIDMAGKGENVTADWKSDRLSSGKPTLGQIAPPLYVALRIF
jgi:hypothetical protein